MRALADRLVTAGLAQPDAARRRRITTAVRLVQGAALLVPLSAAAV